MRILTNGMSVFAGVRACVYNMERNAYFMTVCVRLRLAMTLRLIIMRNLYFTAKKVDFF